MLEELIDNRQAANRTQLEQVGELVTRPLFILIVDDEPAHAEAIRRVLEADKRRYLVEIADSITECRQALERKTPDLILADLNLPDGQAFELLTEMPEAREVPLLVMTSQIDEQSAVRAIKAGAMDYVVKSAQTFSEMPHIIERALREWALIQERRQAEEALCKSLADIREAKDQFEIIFNTSPDANIITHLSDGVVFNVNEGFTALSGFTQDEVNGKSSLELNLYENAADRQRIVKELGENGNCKDMEIVFRRKAGSKFTASISAKIIMLNGAAHVFSSIRDISEQKLALEYGEISREVLQRLNEAGDLQESMQGVLRVLKTRTGFEAVGIRLQDGDDFPYFAQQGFSEGFLLTENTLVERSAKGDVCRDKDGSVCLECTCGQVISGKTDPKNPYVTPGGSCWTNDEASTPFQDTRLHARDRCLHDGFQSVALVPIRNGDRIVGMIQLNDPIKGRLSLKAVELLEGIAMQIGSALMRKRADAALAESQERYHTLFEDSPAILLEEDFSAVRQRLDSLHAQEGVTDFNQYFAQHPEEVAICAGLVQILDANKAALKLHGADSKNELLGKKMMSFSLGTSCEYFRSELENLASGRTHFEIEVTNRTLDGRTVNLAMNWAAAPGHENDLAKVIISMVDITERKQLAEKMIESQKLAGLGTLAAGIAHEINSPLQIVTGSSEILLTKLKEENPDRKGLVRRVERIHENSWRIANIVRSLLDYARNSQENLALVSLNAVVNDTLLLIEHQIHVWSNVEVVTELGENLPDFTCDRNKIIQVLINLVSNARDAMPSGGIVTIGTAYDLHKERLTLAVSDTGSGIPEAVLSRMFDPFFTTKALGQGTGLGLSIVQGIVRSHGGTISVNSQPGKGTAFSLAFPLNNLDEESKIMPSDGRF